MKANELRIGNLVKYVGYPTLVKVERVGQYGIVPDRDINGMQDEEWQLEIFEPIPLTEEWLLKLEFEHDFHHQLGDEYRKGKFSMYYYNGNYPGEKGELLAASIMGNDVEIKYVHQLQNLYFALTGEELTTK